MTLGILLAISVSMILTIPLYARPGFGDDCMQAACHIEGGITLTSNVTDTVEVNSSSSFVMQLGAEGDADELTLVWSNVMSNPSFGFTPTSVIDNGINDGDPTAKKVTGIFTITAPEIPGSYSLQVFAVGSGRKGDTLTTQVTVTSPTSDGTSTENLFPTAYFLYSRNQMTIEFSDRSTDSDGNITHWLWEFGDNTNSTEPNPTHTFKELGTYTVTLTVRDDQEGSNTHSQTFAIPSKGERSLLWTLQVFIGSMIIVFTIVFAVGATTSGKRKRGKES